MKILLRTLLAFIALTSCNSYTQEPITTNDSSTVQPIMSNGTENITQKAIAVRDSIITSKTRHVSRSSSIIEMTSSEFSALIDTTDSLSTVNKLHPNVTELHNFTDTIFSNNALVYINQMLSDPTSLSASMINVINNDNGLNDIEKKTLIQISEIYNDLSHEHIDIVIDGLLVRSEAEQKAQCVQNFQQDLINGSVDTAAIALLMSCLGPVDAVSVAISLGVVALRASLNYANCISNVRPDKH